MDLVFMGTPGFAVPALAELAASRHRVLAVVTNPDRPQGRGQRAAPPPVKVAAGRLGLLVLQPESVRAPGLPEELRALRPDLFVVVAFSVLPRRLLRVPRLGSVNLHPSLLPAYRGAAPIPWAVICGEAETGLTTFLLSPQVDAGDILARRRVPIGPEETAGELEERLSRLGADLVLQTVEDLEAGRARPEPQPQEGATPAPKLTREDARLDWTRPTEALRNLIRGTNPAPGAFTEWGGTLLKVHRAQAHPVLRQAAPGTVLEADARAGLVVATGDGALLLTLVQPAGRTAMSGAAFARGNAVEPGMRLGSPGA
ncbi:MAG: methionyl-tRNA formyltransferase [Candidatus Latescibacterota bacterium]